MTYYTGFSLSLFDDGAAGAAAGTATAGDGATGVNDGQGAAVPVNPNRRAKQSNPLAKVVYGKAAPGAQQEQDAGQSPAAEGHEEAPDLEKEWAELKKGKFKDYYGRDVQSTVQERFKANKATEDKLSQLQSKLAMRYNVADDDFEGVMAALDGDNHAFEQEAMERGMSVDALKQLKELEAFKTQQDRISEQQRQQDEFQRHYEKLVQQSESVKAMFPGFNLLAELQNPTFARLTAPDVGISVMDAYQVVHRDEIQPMAMQVAVQKTQERMSQSIQANANRPTENGLSRSAALDVRDDPSKWSKADREEVKRRVRMGEKIYI